MEFKFQDKNIESKKKNYTRLLVYPDGRIQIDDYCERRKFEDFKKYPDFREFEKFGVMNLLNGGIAIYPKENFD